MAILSAALGVAAEGGNLIPTSGAYGAGLGAGAAVAAERIGWGGSPAAIRPGETAILLHLHRPFGLEEVRVADVGASHDLGRFGFGLAWRHTGVEELYSEQGGEGQAAVRLGSAGTFPGCLDLGAALSLWRRDIAGREAETEGAQGYGLVWRMTPALAAGAMARGIPLLRSPWDGRAGAEQILQAGLEARAGGTAEEDGPAQALRFDVRRTGCAEWRALASLSVMPHPAAELAFGMASAPFQASAGVRLAWSRFALHQAYRHHRHLGSTWLTSLGWSSRREE